MAQIEESNKSGRAVNVDVNLVPFIDLMSVLIVFLLISAVWSQVSMIQIGSSVYGKKTPQEVTPPPRVEIPFRLDVRADGYRIVIGQQIVQIPKLNAQYDQERLNTEVKRIKTIYPDKMDAVITIADELKYQFLIEGMDALLSSGFPEISVATGGVN
jgi:biopolymer transport protein TolR